MYDFFNTSYLAFGDKLTKVFRSLGLLLDDAEANLEIIDKQISYYNRYVNRNYKIATPISGDSPTRGADIFNALKVYPVCIKKLELNGNGGINIAINICNPTNNRITIATGNSGDMGMGYAILKQSQSNNNIEQTITFTTSKGNVDYSGQTIILFKFRVENGRLNMSELYENLPLYASNYDNHYYGITLTDVGPNPTATGYDTFIVRTANTYGYFHGYLVDPDDSTLVNTYNQGGETWYSTSGVAYLYKGEQLKANPNSGDATVFKVNYDNTRRRPPQWDSTETE